MTFKKKCLFPVSVDSHLFRSSAVLEALQTEIEDYDQVLFLVADRLQLYNLAVSAGGAAFWKEERFLERIREYLKERGSWVRKIQRKAGGRAAAQGWDVAGFDRFTDAACFRIFRNVGILYELDPAFRGDVDDSVLKYLESRQSVINWPAAAGLCTRYLLEEIALNLRVRVLEEFFDEYYMGTCLQPLVRLYERSYQASVFRLCELPESGQSFRFCSWSFEPGSPVKSWAPVHYGM